MLHGLFTAGDDMIPASPLQCGLVALFAAWVALSGSSRADDAAREVAADGTVSVVVEPPAAAGSPPNAAAIAAGAARPSPAVGLLAKALGPPDAPETSPSPGRPLPLVEALERSGDRSRRLWITQAYWKVSAGFAGVRFATEVVERLELIAPGGEPHERAVLDVATAAARADLADARGELVAAQQELVDLVRLPVGEPLPWPVDRPLAIPYQTHFDTIFAARPATGRVRAINRMLPSRHEAIEQRAQAIVAAEEAFRLAEADHAKGRQPIEAVAAAQAMLASQQREFCRSIKAYNCDIAEYAMAVADLSVPHEQFAAMLIGTPARWQPAAIGPQTGSPAVITAGATGDGFAQPRGGAAAAGPAGSPPVFVPPPELQPAIPAIPAVPVSPQLTP